MPIKLTHDHVLEGGGALDKKTIKEMVSAYRSEHSSDPHCLKFIHFNLQEVIQLFIDNNAIDPDIPIADQLGVFKDWGLKIYLGFHTALTNCPPDPAYPTNRYLHMDTAILCNTKLLSITWVDQLLDDINFVSMLGAGDGLDRGSICPPNCPPAPDYAGYQHQDILP